MQYLFRRFYHFLLYYFGSILPSVPHNITPPPNKPAEAFIAYISVYLLM